MQLSRAIDECWREYEILIDAVRVKGTDSKFIFIQPEHDYLLMDTAKRFFARLGVDEVNECKTLRKGQMVCKQTACTINAPGRGV